MTDPVLKVVRRELRRLSPTVKIQLPEIKAALTQEVLKREVVEGDQAEDARKKVQRALNKALKAKQVKVGTPEDADGAAVEVVTSLSSSTSAAPTEL